MITNTLNGVTTVGGLVLNGYGIYVAVHVGAVGYFSIWLWVIGTANTLAGILGCCAKHTIALAFFFTLQLMTLTGSVAGAVLLRINGDVILKDMDPPADVLVFLEDHAVYTSNVLIAVSAVELVTLLANVWKIRLQHRALAEEMRAIQWR